MKIKNGTIGFVIHRGGWGAGLILIQNNHLLDGIHYDKNMICEDDNYTIIEIYDTNLIQFPDMYGMDLSELLPNITNLVWLGNT